MGTCEICGGSHDGPNCPTLIKPAAQPLQVAQPGGGAEMVGQTVGNFRLTRLIGEGGFAHIYLGEHPIIGARVAVKILRKQMLDHPETVRRFVGEARATASVLHENVVKVHDISTLADGRYYIVLEYLEGQTLEDFAAGRAQAFEQLAPWLLQICAALDAAHRMGVVHRDLKPDNVFLAKRGEKTIAKLMDFGIARRAILMRGEDRTQTGEILGTPLYMAPEQALGAVADGRADLYSFGVILFRLLTGRFPFEPQHFAVLMHKHVHEAPPRPRSHNPALSPELEALILKTLAKRPDDRYASMAELGEAIAQLLHPPSEPGPTPLARVAVVRQAARFPVEIPVAVELSGGRIERMTIADLSEGGAFLSTAIEPPEVYTRVSIAPLIDGCSPIVAQVRHANPRIDPRNGHPVPGFGVVFVAATDRTLKALRAQLSGVGTRPEIADLKQLFERASSDNFYALLGLQPNTDFPSVRRACDHFARMLDPKRLETLDLADQKRFEEVRAMIARAEETLVDPGARAAYDAQRGNFVGVARCMAAGLGAQQLIELRRKYFEKNPEVVPLIGPHVERARQAEARGDPRTALDELAAALRVDPLDIDLQRRYWKLRRAL